MTCHNCNSICKRFGKHRNGLQRFRCKLCGRTLTEEHTRPLDQMRIPLEKVLLCLTLPIEGNSIRSIERITGVHRDTVLDLLVKAGERCERIFNDRIQGIAVTDVEADEMWGFVGMKKMRRLSKGITDPHLGDAYTYVAIERNTKLVLAWHLGQRDMADTEVFTEKLERATSGHFQLTTDGWVGYPGAVAYSLGTRVDFAQLVKVYAKGDREGEQKYSPLEIVETITKPLIGHPDPRRVCTSIVERSNLSMRTSIRRLTRLTNAFSKKWENLHAALALYFAYYNFCRIHSSIRCTPAMEAGITKSVGP
jgi:transposase-like protein/IS1 family transposase